MVELKYDSNMNRNGSPLRGNKTILKRLDQSSNRGYLSLTDLYKYAF